MIVCMCFLCLAVPIPCTNYDIRLVGGSVESEGRVEVCYNQEWGPVCDDFWDINDARVACRQAGFKDALQGMLLVFSFMELHIILVTIYYEFRLL